MIIPKSLDAIEEPINSNLNNAFVLDRKNLGSTWDISGLYSNFKDLTADNFYIGYPTNSIRITHAGYQYWLLNISKTYDTSKGVLSVKYSIANEPDRNGTLTVQTLSVQPILII